MTELSRSFGHEDVSEGERRIRRVFELVAARYDLMNDLMSCGVHRLWKRRLAQRVAPRAGETIVDLAGGTGDVARVLAEPGRLVAVCDPSIPMMHVGRGRVPAGVAWLAGTAERIPLAGGSDSCRRQAGLTPVTARSPRSP